MTTYISSEAKPWPTLGEAHWTFAQWRLPMASIEANEGGEGPPLTFKNKIECERDALSWQIQDCWDILMLGHSAK